MRGSIVPVVTPFKDGALDLDGLADLLEWQINLLTLMNYI